MTLLDHDEAIRLLNLLNHSVAPTRVVDLGSDRMRRHTKRLEHLIGGEDPRSWRERWRVFVTPANVGMIGFATCVLVWVLGVGYEGSKSLHAPTPALAHIREFYGSVHVVSPASQPRPARTGQAVVAHSRVTVGRNSDARLVLASGAQVDVVAASALGLEQVDRVREDIVLESGTVALKVPKLPAGHSLSVRTAIARVTVFGTAFQVTVDGATSIGQLAARTTRTCVTVTEGGVLVEHAGAALRVTAGNHWSSDGRSCNRGSGASGTEALVPISGRSSASSPGSDPPGDGSAPAVELLRVPPVDSARSSAAFGTAELHGPSGAVNPERISGIRPADSGPLTGTQPISTLEQENAVFAEAVKARRRGDTRIALRLFDELLTRYPRSPLAGQARMERCALLTSPGLREKSADHSATLECSKTNSDSAGVGNGDPFKVEAE